MGYSYQLKLLFDSLLPVTWWFSPAATDVTVPELFILIFIKFVVLVIFDGSSQVFSFWQIVSGRERWVVVATLKKYRNLNVINFEI